MKVFISWSGSTSKAVAEALRGWLPSVIQAIEPWMSSEDIEKGARWSPDIADQLEDSNVCPYLFGVEPPLTGPLGQFQATKALEEDDTRRLIQTLNRALGANALSDTALDKTFEVWWHELEQDLEKIPLEKEDIAVEPPREEREMIEEVLELVRTMGRDVYSLQSGLRRLESPEERMRSAAELWPLLASMFRGREPSVTPSYRLIAEEATKQQPEETGGTLIIESAKYGAEDHYNDVTDVVKSVIKAGKVGLPVNNEYFGPDPIEKVPKEVEVVYLYAGRRYSKTAPEGGTLLLP